MDEGQEVLPLQEVQAPQCHPAMLAVIGVGVLPSADDSRLSDDDDVGSLMRRM